MCYSSTIFNMCYATPVQPKIGTDKISERCTHSTWFFYALRNDFRGWHLHNLTSLQRYHCTLHSHNLAFTTFVQLEISGLYTCTTWNLYLYGKVTYFTLHSHTLIFITFAKHDFCGFFILVVCMFSYIYIISYLYLCLN